MTNLHAPLIIVTPYYEDGAATTHLIEELMSQLSGKLPGQFHESKPHLVLVDDGSIHEPFNSILLENNGFGGDILYLKRNLGHQRAIAVGLSYVATHFPTGTVVVMDSDGEDKPASIIQLLQQLEASPNADIVVATRKSRVESWRFQFFYFWYKLFFQLATGRSISFGNFMVLKPHAVKRIAVMQELWIHFAGTVLLSKLRISKCPIDRGLRYAGKSKMNFVGLVLHGFKGLMVFAEDVFVRVGIFCAVIAIISLLLMPIPLMLKFMGMASPGWASILIGVFLLIFIQTGTLTLLTLLLTGLTKGGGVTDFSYELFVAKKEHVFIKKS